MKLSTEIGSIADIVGEKKAVELCGKAGFTAWDLSMFNRNRLNFVENKAYGINGEVVSNDLVKFAKELKKIGLDYGMVCNQSHAPFPSIRPEIRDCFKKAIEMTAEAGGKICVIHPCNDYTPEQNAEMYNEFLPFAKSHGVKIATENMWNWSNEKDEALPAACCDEESFVANVDAVGDDYLVACLDIGHAEMRGLNATSVGLIKALGHKRLKALHIHDNDLHYDSHEIPFSMDIDFDAIIKALKGIDYDGDLTLECPGYINKFNKDNVDKAVKNLYDSVKKLYEMYKSL